jgi:hypothetical protein
VLAIYSIRYGKFAIDDEVGAALDRSRFGWSVTGDFGPSAQMSELGTGTVVGYV